MTESKTTERPKDGLRKEIVYELERSITVLKNNDGSFNVDIGSGAIKFTINPFGGTDIR